MTEMCSIVSLPVQVLKMQQQMMFYRALIAVFLRRETECLAVKTFQLW